MIPSFSVVLLGALSGCSDPPAPVGERSATLGYSTNVDGEIEPCG